MNIELEVPNLQHSISDFRIHTIKTRCRAVTSTKSAKFRWEWLVNHNRTTSKLSLLRQKQRLNHCHQLSSKLLKYWHLILNCYASIFQQNSSDWWKLCEAKEQYLWSRKRCSSVPAKISTNCISRTSTSGIHLRNIPSSSSHIFSFLFDEPSGICFVSIFTIRDNQSNHHIDFGSVGNAECLSWPNNKFKWFKLSPICSKQLDFSH